jgi:pimeloyl-ACP methyl ester carboxylesterase
MPPRLVEGAGVELACEERGAGPVVLLVHGIAERAASWAAAAEQLAAAGARAIAYDRRGYGRSGAPEPYERTTVAEQAEDAAALLAALDAAPAVVCGRDIGALVCLDLVRRHRSLVAAAAVVDPPLYQFSLEATEALASERVRLEEVLRRQGAPAAVQDWLAARGADEQRIGWGREDHRAFFADYAGLPTWPVLRRDLRALEVPLAVLVSDTASSYVHGAADALTSLVPGATRAPAGELVAVVRGLLGSR